MKMIVTMPAPNGVPLDEAAAAKLEGQWVTVLAFGQRVMGQVQAADPIEETYGVPYVGLVVIIDTSREVTDSRGGLVCGVVDLKTNSVCELGPHPDRTEHYGPDAQGQRSTWQEVTDGTE